MNTRDERGFALIAVIVLMALLMTVLAAYATLTGSQLSVTRSTIGATRGFYAAEAGLNLRADQVRRRFLGYERPSGTSPTDGGGFVPCEGGNQGSGDFSCVQFDFGGRQIVTYVTEDPANPGSIVVPPGEPFENLRAQQYSYGVQSVARNLDSRPEAILELEFASRLVPMFQFAAFYNKDLEVHPGPPMTLAGPVHSNGDLYLGSSGGLDILGQVTTAGSIYQGRKTDQTCYAGGVRVPDPGSTTPLPACPTASLVQYSQPDFIPWNGMIRTLVEPVSVPPPQAFEPTPGARYWDAADARVMLKLGDGPPRVELRNPDNSVDVSGSATMNGCHTGTDYAVGLSNSFHNLREAKSIDMLEIDVTTLLNCFNQHNSVLGGKALDDTTHGGLVLYLGVDGPDSAGINGYGVRLEHGDQLAGTTGSPPPIAGLTVVSDQAVYVKGDYNATAKRPAAILADSINVLSDAYVDGEHVQTLSHADRLAVPTTINAAFLAGTDVTGGIEGPGGQGGAYNGGLENYPRLHEKWSGIMLTYRGSFVSLDSPQHVNGPHGTPDLYSPPIRNWGFDTDFNDAANLPPLTPRFVYLKQDLFVRNYEY